MSSSSFLPCIEQRFFVAKAPSARVVVAPTTAGFMQISMERLLSDRNVGAQTTDREPSLRDHPDFNDGSPIIR
jgi:hypothetical protein